MTEQNTSGYFTRAETIAFSGAHANTIKNWRNSTKGTSLIRKTGTAHGARYTYAPEFVVLMRARAVGEDGKSSSVSVGGKPPGRVMEAALSLLLSGVTEAQVAEALGVPERQIAWIGLSRVPKVEIEAIFEFSQDKAAADE